MERNDGMQDKQPFFSIIVPTFNRPFTLTHCLQSLERLDYPRDRFEVIVVDDGSESAAETVVSHFGNRLNATLITQTHSGPATARNKGAAHAKGEFLAFTDDDCTPAVDWLKALAHRFNGTPDDMIGGRTLNVLLHNSYSAASHFLIEYFYSYYNAHSDQARFFASNNVSLAAGLFHRLGGFNPIFPHAGAEDREFCERWLRQGFRMTYAPEALIYHAHRLTFRSFFRQQFNYGRGAFRFHHLRAHRRLHRLRLGPFSFYVNMLRYPMSEIQGPSKYLFLGLIVLSQGTNAAGFLWEMVTQILRKNNPGLLSRYYD
jgi:glycosyltransferase involved in cell wall biosynthesis